jgi:hypothetical protein
MLKTSEVYKVEMAGIGHRTRRVYHPPWGPDRTKNAPIVWMRFKVEMAGIEPASERLDPRKSTSVAGWARRRSSLSRQI